MLSIKELVKLTQKKFRREMGFCIIEGEKLVSELGDKCIEIFAVAGSRSMENVAISCRANVISQKDYNQITNLENGGVLAVMSIPTADSITFPYLVLDGVQDPGNVGTLLRTACAFGFNTIFCINSADVWSQKVIRSAMGAQFRLNVFDLDHEEFSKIYNDKLLTSRLYIADMLPEEKRPYQNPVQVGDDCLARLMEFRFSKCGLVLGNEGQGVSDEIRALPHKIISVPMAKGSVESLNVAIAGGILMNAISGQEIQIY